MLLTELQLLEEHLGLTGFVNQLILFERFDSKQPRNYNLYVLHFLIPHFLKSHYIKRVTEIKCGLHKVSFCPIGDMGCCWRWWYTTCTCCMSEDEKSAVAVHNEIKRILADQKKRERREIKILLLGKIFLPIKIYLTIDTEEITQGDKIR